jgi:hypothetical protein
VAQQIREAPEGPKRGQSHSYPSRTLHIGYLSAPAASGVNWGSEASVVAAALSRCPCASGHPIGYLPSRSLCWDGGSMDDSPRRFTDRYSCNQLHRASRLRAPPAATCANSNVRFDALPGHRHLRTLDSALSQLSPLPPGFELPVQSLVAHRHDSCIGGAFK